MIKNFEMKTGPQRDEGFVLLGMEIQKASMHSARASFCMLFLRELSENRKA